MNIVCFSATRPYDVHRWSKSLFEMRENKSVQLIHPNKYYDRTSEIVICWSIDAYEYNKDDLINNNAFVILMEDRLNRLAQLNITPADTVIQNETDVPPDVLDIEKFDNIVFNEYRNHDDGPYIINKSRSLPYTNNEMLPKHKLLLKYLHNSGFEFIDIDLTEDTYEDLVFITRNNIYTKPPFNITPNVLVQICDIERYEKWLDASGVIVKYPLHIVLSISTRELIYINEVKEIILKHQLSKSI
ncbi:hypothetical protein NGC32_08465 [Kluyvera cryocrescens]|uniref:hypothetical protein n=1 Tax=Kluyvera cryocrescens TaxID=580 RepID=UPI002DBD5B6E|nr:hypothetical protein [Kluyvera cryocrescens]MEB7712761.1 hypothetical protein [Kluyvera cryocrescens]